MHISKFQKLSAGDYLIFDLNTKSLSVKSYWTQKYLSKSIETIDDKINQFSTIFNNAVKRHTFSDVPIGVLLSGGVDSSLVTAFASKNVNKLKTFTVIFPKHKIFNEAQHARTVSKYFSTNHMEIEISDNILPRKFYHF